MDRAAYDASRLDLKRLQGYAQRVARDTRKPPVEAVRQKIVKEESYLAEESYGLLWPRTRHVQKTRNVDCGWKTVLDAHWVLHGIYHNIDQHHSWGHEEYHENVYWLLMTDGSLKKYTKWLEEKSVHPFREDGSLLADMTVLDIERLDFQDRYMETGRSGRGTHTYGNREPGKLMRHARGVGISLALKKLLD